MFEFVVTHYKKPCQTFMYPAKCSDAESEEKEPSNNSEEDNGYRCKICDKTFQSLNGRYLHEKKHTGNYKLVMIFSFSESLKDKCE